MMEVQQLLSPQEWAEQTFGGVQLGHVARGRRAIVIAAAMAREPAGSVPAQQQSDAGTKAVYRFCENAHVSYEALMQPHVEATREQSRQVPRVLLIQDTSRPWIISTIPPPWAWDPLATARIRAF
jgi:Transposase DNA-binding